MSLLKPEPTDENAEPGETREPSDSVKAMTAQIRRLRRVYGWTAAELGERMQRHGVNWNRAVVANVEHGRRQAFTVDELLALAVVFDRAPVDFLPSSQAARWIRGDAEHKPRRFVLRRLVDVSGISGTGDVADGVEWPDGSASIRWRGKHPSLVQWDHGLDSIEEVHGHQGATELVWLDPETEVQP